jgi:hypothetical protein
MASLELATDCPPVRAWSGSEQAAEKKAGWMVGDRYEINVCLNTADCEWIAVTSAHEVKHVEQYAGFPNLTNEQRERDAEEFAKEFEARVFGNQP